MTMSGKIDDDDPASYYKKVAEELERIANSVVAQPHLDRGLSARLLAFAQQIRRDSDLDCPPLGITIN
jgi:hypothetical protein